MTSYRQSEGRESDSSRKLVIDLDAVVIVMIVRGLEGGSLMPSDPGQHVVRPGIRVWILDCVTSYNGRLPHPSSRARSRDTTFSFGR